MKITLHRIARKSDQSDSRGIYIHTYSRVPLYILRTHTNKNANNILFVDNRSNNVRDYICVRNSDSLLRKSTSAIRHVNYLINIMNVQ